MNTEKETIDWQVYVIERYRESVRQRYDFELLNKKFTLPNSIDEILVAKVKAYFLSALYPPQETRKELEVAFSYLSDYIHQPAKVFKLIGNMSSAIFTFGLQLPKALRAGVVSLQAFLDAKKFEESIQTSVKELALEIPISDADFMRSMANIPEKEARKFLRDIEQLLNIITDTKLLLKTVEVLESVIAKMQRNPDTFSQEEISGIQLGIEIMKDGFSIFKTLDSTTKKNLINLIMQVERDFMAQIYAKDPA